MQRYCFSVDYHYSQNITKCSKLPFLLVLGSWKQKSPTDTFCEGTLSYSEFHFIDVGFSLFKAQALVKLVGNDTGRARSEHQRHISLVSALLYHLIYHHFSISLAPIILVNHHIFYPCLSSCRTLIDTEGYHSDDFLIIFQSIEMALR